LKNLVTVFLILLLAQSVLACPFCNPGESDIFGDIADASAVVLVQKIDTRKYKVLKTLLGQVKVGRIVVAAEPQGQLGKEGHLLLTTAGPPNLPYWSDPPRALTDVELEFAKRCLSMSDATDAQKWDFAAKHLEHPSKEISSAAYNLLASAPLAEVQKRRTVVGQSKLLEWAQNSKLAPERRALYLLMGYQHYQKEEADWIAKELFSKQLSASSPLVGPMAMAFLQLKGVEGLRQLVKTFYPPTLPASRVTPLNRALTLVHEQSEDGALRKAINDLFLRELEHPQRGAFVLAPLALWQDPSGGGKAEELFKKNQNVTWVKVAVIRYFRSFNGPTTEAALGRLAQVDPDLVKRTQDPYRRADLGID
jgi:hypothetical protein